MRWAMVVLAAALLVGCAPSRQLTPEEFDKAERAYRLRMAVDERNRQIHEERELRRMDEANKETNKSGKE